MIVQTADAAAAFGSARDLVDDAAAAALGLNRTDFRVLVVLSTRPEGVSAGELSDAVSLSPAATTEAVQRLGSRGLAHRRTDPDDRRRARITAGERAVDMLDELFGPLAAGGEALLTRYTMAQLELILDFLERGRTLQLTHAARIRGTTPES